MCAFGLRLYCFAAIRLKILKGLFIFDKISRLGLIFFSFIIGNFDAIRCISVGNFVVGLTFLGLYILF